MLEDLLTVGGCLITNFKKGDVIIRVIPFKVVEEVYNENLGTTREIIRGSVDVCREPVEFLEVANNLIWLRDVVECSGCHKKHLLKLNLEDFADGWELFKAPEGLTVQECAKANKHDEQDLKSIIRRIM